MIAPIFPIANDDAAVRAALLHTDGTLKVYPFGEAPQDIPTPYAVYTTVTGTPENYLGESPDFDVIRSQIDIYADDETALDAAAKALRDALEGASGYIASFFNDKDPQTKRLRFSFDITFHVTRN